MAKKKKNVICWECKKGFKREEDVKSHASAKKHQWCPPAPSSKTANGVAITSKAPTVPKPAPVFVAARASSSSTPALVKPTPSPPAPAKKQNTATNCWLCPQCGLSFYGPFTLDLHYGQVHSEQQQGNWQFFVKNCRKCPSCDEQSVDQNQLRWHMVIKNTCSDCMQHQASPDALAEHRRVAHVATSEGGAGSIQTSGGEKQDATTTPDLVSAAVPSTTTDSTISVPFDVSEEKRIVTPATSESLTQTTASPKPDLAIVGGPGVARQVATPSDTAPSSVSSVKSSTENDLTAESTGASNSDADFDDIASVVSYASFVEVPTSDTVAPIEESVQYEPNDAVASKGSESPFSDMTDATRSVRASPRRYTFALPTENRNTETAPPVEHILQGSSKDIDGTTGPTRLSSPSLFEESTSACLSLMRFPVGTKHVVEEPEAPRQRALLAPVDLERPPQSVPGATEDKATCDDTGTAGIRAHADVPKNVSWHCRSCKKDQCDSPVATICGHIFCQSCILRELGENGHCPVCKRMFLLHLDVGI